MSVQKMSKRLTAPEIRDRKGGEPIVCAHLLSRPHGGDCRQVCGSDPAWATSLGMVMHGYETDRAGAARPYDHARPRRGARGEDGRWSSWTCRSAPMRRARRVAFRNAARVMKETDCGAIKLEGGKRMAETIRYLTRARHSGDGAYRPDAAIHQRLGGFKTQGRTRDQWAAHRGGRARGGGGRGVRRRAGGDGGAARGRITAHVRSRPSASARRRPATGRSW